MAYVNVTIMFFKSLYDCLFIAIFDKIIHKPKPINHVD